MASRKVPVSCCARTLTRGVSGSRAEAGSTTILAEVAGALGRRNDPGSLSFFLPLFTRVRGGGILRTSCLRRSPKFRRVPRSSLPAHDAKSTPKIIHIGDASSTWRLLLSPPDVGERPED